MSLLGKAAVAMWWSIRPEQRAEFGDWHSHEHFPERMSIPGFRRGSRWSSTTDAEGFFVLYELEQYEVLTSKFYLDRLNAPTPWSTRMMPHHLGMVRSQCRIVASFGGGVATSLATIRLSPETGRDAELQTQVSQMLGALAQKPGLTGAHLLQTDTPRTSAPTTEQQIRGRTLLPTGSCCCQATMPMWSRVRLPASSRGRLFKRQALATRRRSASTGWRSR